jgi:hypothetical protein
MQSQLKEECKTVVAYSTAADKSTHVKNIAQLSVFIQGVNAHFELVEKLLELVPMKGKTRADEMFSQFVTFLKQIRAALGKNGWLC